MGQDFTIKSMSWLYLRMENHLCLQFIIIIIIIIIIYFASAYKILHLNSWINL